jgi:hypothetical protein
MLIVPPKCPIYVLVVVVVMLAADVRTPEADKLHACLAVELQFTISVDRAVSISAFVQGGLDVI